MKINPELITFLAPYDEKIQKLVLQLREFIIDTLPTTNELIWDNYNAVAIAYSKSDKLKDAYCHLAVYTNHVNFGFNRGAQLTKQEFPLQGKGKLIRHITIKKIELFPANKIKIMLFEAIGLSEKLNDKLIDSKLQSKSIVMSTTKNKRRPYTN